jgi:SPP1 gp7 family putative phage head morphogenesis protein
LYDQEGFEKSFTIYAKQLQMGAGIDLRKISYTDPRFNLFNNLNADAARFTAFREAQKQRELSAAKTDLDKAKVEKRYNEYQLTEKQGIFANAAAAERWQGFQENADLYPNLEWRTAGDSDVRPEHAALQGLVLPINDPFWKTHTPPLGFGCRCELIQTDEKVVKPEGYKDVPAPKGFDFNPGIDQTLFSDSAGYYTSAPEAEAIELTKTASDFIIKQSRQYGKDNIGVAVKNKIGEIALAPKSRREWINQPHAHYQAKNMMLENLDFLKSLKFTKAPAKSGTDVKHTWISKITLMKNTSVVIVKEFEDGKLILYSISDSVEPFKKYLK